MKDVIMRWTWCVVLALAAGCDGIELEQLVRQHPALTRIAPEPAGANCEHGGRVVLSGLDRDGDGVLADAEVTGTEYVCASAVPDVLVRTKYVAPGEQCPLGGQVSRAGLDANGNGDLEDGEVTREVYGCKEEDPVVYRIIPLSHPVGTCFRSSSQVEAGLDLDRDGVLDTTERLANTIVCTETSFVRVRQRPEPAGSRCPTGGTRVEAGTDLDGNDALEDTEVEASAYVCQPLRTYDGDYVVRTAADVAALEGISRLRGNLAVVATSVTEVVLPALMVVEGFMTINSNDSLTRLELPGLRFVGGSIDVSFHLLLETLDLGGASSGAVWLEGGLTVETNPRLTTLAGLSNLVPRGTITLRENDAIENPGTFNYLEAHPGSIVVYGNDRLQRLPFSHLGQLGGNLEVTDNDALSSLAGTTLRSVGGNLSIIYNDALVDLSGLAELESVTGSLEVVANKGLRSTAGLSALSSLGSLIIAGNDALESTGNFPLLTDIDSNLEITANVKLTSVGTFDLRSTKRLHLGFNPLLTDLSGLSRLRAVQLLRVNNNAALQSLAALSGLREVVELAVLENASLASLGLDGLERVESIFTVMENPVLPTCRATALAARVFGGSPGIFGNDDTATCN